MGFETKHSRVSNTYVAAATESHGVLLSRYGVDQLIVTCLESSIFELVVDADWIRIAFYEWKVIVLGAVR